MSISQMVINIEQELELMIFEENDEWEKHIDKFHFLLPKLGSDDKPVSMKVKDWKLLRTLPTRFAPTAMLAESNRVVFERVIASGKDKIFRQNTQEKKAQVQTHVAALAGKAPLDSNIERRYTKTRQDVCLLCGRKGYYANRCWY